MLKRLLVKLFKWSLVAGFMMLGIGLLIAGYFYKTLSKDLPSVNALQSIEYEAPLKVVTSSGDLMAEFGAERRIPLVAEDIPEQLKHAFLAAEDDRFYEHPGVDYQGLMRAAWVLLKTGERSQGGSTITMQVAREFFLTPERSYERKAREILLSLEIEKQMEKDEILALYLNQMFMGNRAYGVAAAANVYYGKELSNLSLPEAAMIAGLPKAPSKFNPIVNPERANLRRNYVLRRMSELGFITADEYKTALAEPLTAKLVKPKADVDAYYVAEAVREQLHAEHGDDIYTSGWTVYTTINSQRQQAANEAIRKHVLDYEFRHGFVGVEDHLDISGSFKPEEVDKLMAKYSRFEGLTPGLVIKSDKDNVSVYIGEGDVVDLTIETMEWAKERLSEDKQGSKIKDLSSVLSPGDVIRVTKIEDQWKLAQLPTLQGALVSMSPMDGHVQALVGGYDFFHSRFNRATQATRQPGSSFKPFVYSAALARGYTPATTFNDAPVVFRDSNLNKAWRPENYSGRFYGPTRLRTALTKSRNLVSIRVLKEVGIEFTLQHIQDLKIANREFPADLSLSLGSGVLTPMELAGGYSSFANGGYRVEPYFVEKIVDISGALRYQHQPVVACTDNCEEVIGRLEEFRAIEVADEISAAERVLPSAHAYQMVSMMQDVVRAGTATKAKKLGRSDLAGKTGTTNDQFDAWFSGYSQDLVSTVWFGFDEPAPLGRKESGGNLALPAWVDYMEVALQGTTERKWQIPPGMITLRIDSETGLVMPRGSSGGVLETFQQGRVPKQMSAAVIKDIDGADMPEQIF